MHNRKNPDWRKQLYTNQKKYNKKTINPFLFEAPFLLKSNTTTSLLLLMMIGSVLSEELNSVPVAKLVNRKMIKDTNADLSKLAMTENCQQVVNTISSTAEKLPVSKAPMQRVFERDEFKIICTTTNRIEKLTHVGASAFFVPASTTIHLSSQSLTEGLIHHEFIHADSFFRHRTKSCFEENIIDAIFPIFPATNKNIKKYQKALDKGDDRVRDFKNLWGKEQKKLVLTSVERDRLYAYKAASKNCLAPIIRDINPIQTYQKILDLGWYPNKKDFTITKEGITMRVISVEKSSTATIIIMKPETSFYSVLHILDKLEEKLVKGSYKDLPKKLKLTERDAFTFEFLSQEAIDLFYPEANQLRLKDIEKCTDKENNSSFKKDEF